MNLYLTKISRSYVKEVMWYQRVGPTSPPPPPPLVSYVVPKPLVSERLKGHSWHSGDNFDKNIDFLKIGKNSLYTLEIILYK